MGAGYYVKISISPVERPRDGETAKEREEEKG